MFTQSVMSLQGDNLVTHTTMWKSLKKHYDEWKNPYIKHIMYYSIYMTSWKDCRGTEMKLLVAGRGTGRGLWRGPWDLGRGTASVLAGLAAGWGQCPSCLRGMSYDCIRMQTLIKCSPQGRALLYISMNLNYKNNNFYHVGQRGADTRRWQKIIQN